MATFANGPQIGGRSPWGTIDFVKQIGPEAWSVGTPGHGGVKLSRKLNALIPESARADGGWYEEDCAWAIPYLVLCTAGHNFCYLGGSELEAKLDAAISTVKNWNPDFYTEFTGIKVSAKESYVVREREFEEAHKNDWQVLCAYGDWHKDVPKGFVGVVARVGGRSKYGQGNERSFIVPAEDYEARGGTFIVDPDRHEHRTQALV